MKNEIKYPIAVTLCLTAILSQAQQPLEANVPALSQTNKKGSSYKFTEEKMIPAFPVQSQGRTGTCWSFSTVSYFESEILKAGKMKGVKLSEMYVVREIYALKAENFIRMHGKANFGEGGEPTDILECWKKFGLVPLEAYNGKLDPSVGYNHKLLDSTLQSEVVKMADPKNQKIDLTECMKRINTLLDQFLGAPPDTFAFQGKKYSPKSFAAALGIMPQQYELFTSFSHHPYYQKFILEVPDNWAWKQYMNLPLNEMVEIIDNAILNGYGVAWASDVSEQDFRFRDGLALVPKGWETMTESEKNACYMKPCLQEAITPEMRQMGYDNYETQDDHGMHIIGMAKDQDGNKYFVVKNSWGKDRNECGGYFYVSEAYLKLKTISITVNRKAVPATIQKKITAFKG